jgi:DNA-binding protein HU-beta
MNKTELASKINQYAGLTQKDAVKFIDSFIAVVKKEVAKGEKVQLIGFGTFEAKKRSARSGVNPQSGEKIEIPASTVPKFSPGKALKDAVNG